jgi:hypothetical protein
MEHSGLRSGTYIYKGHLTNNVLGDRYNLPVKEIEFLIAGLSK